MRICNPFRSRTDAASAELLERATSPRHAPPSGVKLEPIVPPTVGTANMETSAGRIQIRVEAMSGRLVRQVLLAAAAQAECFPEAYPHAQASSGFKAAIDEVMGPLAVGDPRRAERAGPAREMPKGWRPDALYGGRLCNCPICTAERYKARPGAPEPMPGFGLDLGSGRDRSVVHQVDGTKVQPPAPPLVVGRNFRTPDEGPPIVAGVILDENDQPLDLRIRPVRVPGPFDENGRILGARADDASASMRDMYPAPADGPSEAPIASEAGSGPPEAARSTFIPPLDSEVAAALSAKIGDAVMAANGRMFGMHTGLRRCDEGFPLPRSEAPDRQPAGRPADPAAAASEADKGDTPPHVATAAGMVLNDPESWRMDPPEILSNIATAAQAAAADPTSATLSDTLAGARAVEQQIEAALTAFESEFRGCAVNDVRIERAAKLDGSSRIAGVLIDLKLQNAQI